MKIPLIYFVGVICSSLLLTGCETAQVAVKPENRPRFYEGARADVILKFNRWDTIHLLRPDSREGGFLPILTRADVEAELKTQHVNRELAVVVLGFLFPPDLESLYVGEWDALLSSLGFKRIVVLRTGVSRDIDGLLIIHDSAIAAGHDRQRTTAPLAALPAPAGAHAADPSRR